MSDRLVLSDLLDQMQACGERLSMTSQTRRLLWLASEVLRQQADQLRVYREKEQAQERRIIVPGA